MLRSFAARRRRPERSALRSLVSVLSSTVTRSRYFQSRGRAQTSSLGRGPRDWRPLFRRDMRLRPGAPTGPLLGPTDPRTLEMTLIALPKNQNPEICVYRPPGFVAENPKKTLPIKSNLAKFLPIGGSRRDVTTEHCLDFPWMRHDMSGMFAQNMSQKSMSGESQATFWRCFQGAVCDTV